MADNSFVAKWNVYDPEAEAPAEGEQKGLQFFKDGSCVVPLSALGGEDESASYLFYQVFENGTVRFEPGPGIYRYKLDGDILTILWLDGSKEFLFAKEGKKSFIRKVSDTAAVVKPKKEEIPDREPEEHEWKCPSCGKINQNYVGTCGCGEPKPKDKPAYNWAEVHPELVKEEPPVAEEPEPVPEEEVVAKPKKDAPPEREPEEHEWKCPVCGKINQNYVGTCGCGEPKPKDKPAFNWAEVHPELVKTEPVVEEKVEEPEEEIVEKPKKDAPPEREPEEHEWKCPVCGKINQNYVGTCGCGEPKPKDKPAFNWAEVHPELVKSEPAPVEKKEEPEEKAVEKPKKDAPPERVPTENEWKCPNCGKINQNYVGTCGCGEGKPKAAPAPAAEPSEE